MLDRDRLLAWLRERTPEAQRPEEVFGYFAALLAGEFDVEDDDG